MAGKTVKPKPMPDVSSRIFEEIIIPPEKKRRNTEPVKTSIRIWNTTKYLIY